MTRSILAPLVLGCVLLAASACGSSGATGSAGPGPASSPSTLTPPASSGSGQTSTAGALVAEAQQTAAGDIPDNQVFLVLRNAAGGYSMKYPEGWAVSGSGQNRLIRDKNNVIRITLMSGGAPTAASVGADMRRLATQTPSLKAAPPKAHPTCTFMSSTRPVTQAAYRVDYSTLGAPDPVTGKAVKLLVNRYYLAHAGKVAVLDLGTPQGVDNVDAYCLMATSFRWK